ncbi:MAG: ferrous iron transport protein A [Candidatus Omnitrophica bacterium]|nr:ferrous iron transport protein A [Candidatus Omnitrophota bacterium]
MLKDLTQMEEGELGIIKEFRGGIGFVRRIESLGIREGKKIKKISSQFLRGPQTIEIDNCQFAIGFGMAKKILVEVK